VIDPVRTIATVESHPWTAWPEWSQLWSELAASCPERSFFLSPEWIESWLEVFGPVTEPSLLVFRGDRANSRDAVGICLLGSRRERCGPIPVRRAYLNTAGEDEADEACAEYNATLSRKGWELPVAAALWAHLKLLSWDEFEARGMMAGDSLEALIAARPERVTVRRRNVHSYFVDLRKLDRSPESYLKALSRNTREQVRRSLRLLEQEGPLAVRVASDLAEAMGILEELARLHQARWEARGRSGVFASPRFRDFHRRLIERAFPQGTVHLLQVRAGEQSFAALYNFVLDGKVYFYQSGVRSGLDRRIKPGLAAHICAVSHYLKAGLHEYDFLAGEAQYKQSLSTDSRELSWVVFQRPRLRLRMLALLRRTKGRLWRRWGRRHA
jgi:CelD/BcsL family acetyltransferase involved in cellulose biosynthesis